MKSKKHLNVASSGIHYLKYDNVLRHQLIIKLIQITEHVINSYCWEEPSKIHHFMWLFSIKIRIFWRPYLTSQKWARHCSRAGGFFQTVKLTDEFFLPRMTYTQSRNNDNSVTWDHIETFLMTTAGANSSCPSLKKAVYRMIDSR